MNVRLKTMVGVLGFSAVGVVALSAARSPFPSDEALQATFAGHRADFVRLVVMANEDTHLTRIAPDFTWLDDDVAWPRKNVGISEQRWSDYKQLFQKIGASEGILNYTNPTLIMFPIASIGSVSSGAEKGLAYSQASLSPVLKSLDERPPDEFWNGPDRSHVLVYKPIDRHWYIYYRQW
jgi:hypothetical protein